MLSSASSFVFVRKHNRQRISILVCDHVEWERIRIARSIIDGVPSISRPQWDWVCEKWTVIISHRGDRPDFSPFSLSSRCNIVCTWKEREKSVHYGIHSRYTQWEEALSLIMRLFVLDASEVWTQTTNDARLVFGRIGDRLRRESENVENGSERRQEFAQFAIWKTCRFPLESDTLFRSRCCFVGTNHRCNS